jgi:hypothetical protein
MSIKLRDYLKHIAVFLDTRELGIDELRLIEAINSARLWVASDMELYDGCSFVVNGWGVDGFVGIPKRVYFTSYQFPDIRVRLLDDSGIQVEVRKGIFDREIYPYGYRVVGGKIILIPGGVYKGVLDVVYLPWAKRFEVDSDKNETDDFIPEVYKMLVVYRACSFLTDGDISKFFALQYDCLAEQFRRLKNGKQVFISSRTEQDNLRIN